MSVLSLPRTPILPPVLLVKTTEAPPRLLLRSIVRTSPLTKPFRVLRSGASRLRDIQELLPIFDRFAARTDNCDTDYAHRAE